MWADFRISLSVFEQAYDRTGYLEMAPRHLTPNGALILSCNDGFLRNGPDLYNPRSWLAALRWCPETPKAWWPTVVSPLSEAGQLVGGRRSHSLAPPPCLSRVLQQRSGPWKTVPAEEAWECQRLWLNPEESLTRPFVRRERVPSAKPSFRAALYP